MTTSKQSYRIGFGLLVFLNIFILAGMSLLGSDRASIGLYFLGLSVPLATILLAISWFPAGDEADGEAR